MGCKLTLISAPAGFGKTTLVSEWIASPWHRPPGQVCGRPVAWLSLDEGDSDPVRFISYLVAALQTIKAGIGEGLLAALHASQPQPPQAEAILTTLLNEITVIPERFLLILDDYHSIDSQPVDQSLAFLVEHQPPQMRLVVATREDPSLPLARLRACGQLTELRTADLRFTSAEAAEFLNHVMGLNLSAEDIAALETRTEGWIAGLQMAALSMQGRADTASFIQAFTGSHRFVLDYLVEEVLQRQPENVRSFLLQTAILDRLCGPLCDAVTGQEDGRGMLEVLERGNLFVVPLDDQRQWYRYHHLFADVLQARSMEEQPNQVSALHRRASEWYEQKDLPADAIHHALAAEDFERAADLAELAWPAWSEGSQSIAWLGWLKDLPDELVRARPVLSLSYAWAFLNSGKLEAAESRLRDVERWLEPTENTSGQPEMPATKMVVVDEEQFRSLPVSLATARAYHAQAIGDAPGAVKYAQRVLDLLPEGKHYERGAVTALLGLAHWTSGDLEAAYRTFSDGLARMNPLDIITGTFVLADIQMTLGHLHAAVSACEHALQIAIKRGEPYPIGTEDVYSGISELHREQGDLETAAQDLATSKRLGKQIELPDWQYRWCIAQAHLQETLGNLDRAIELLDEAERVFVRTPLPNVRPIAASKARVWVRQGRLTEALSWARERGLSVDDDLSYLREFEHITLVRALIARYKNNRVDDSIHEALGLLERLLQAAEAGKRMGSVIEILVLQALAHQAQGDIPLALVSLERGLTLAEPEGYIRIFVDEGSPMAQLLSEAAARGIMPDYVDKLLAAFEGATKDERQKTETAPSSFVLRPSSLIEPLSQRELEILKLIAQGLSNREISERLFLALDTVKGHNRRIYGKLQVQRRTEAIARARELGLL